MPSPSVGRAGVFSNTPAYFKQHDPIYEQGQYLQIPEILASRQQQYSPVLQGWTPTGGKSPWVTPAQAAYQPASSVGGQEANPFSVVSNTKNTQIQSLLDKVLAQSSASISGGVNSNPYTLYQNTKDQSQAQDIAGARDRFGNATAGTQQQLQDFTKEWLAGNAPVRQFADQDIAAVGNLYGAESDPNSLRGQFSQNAREDALAMQRLVGRGLDQLGGQLKSNRFMSGDDSRTTARAFNAGAQLLNQEAVRQAQLRRDNLLRTTDYQMANVGRRQQIDDAARMRGLVPLNASYAQSAAELGQLGQLGNLTNANTVLNQDTAETRAMRQLGVIGAGQGIDERNNFYNLRRPYEPDFSGYAPTGARRGTGGGYPVGGGSDPGYYEPDFSGGVNPGGGGSGGVNPNGQNGPPRTQFYPDTRVYNRPPPGPLEPGWDYQNNQAIPGYYDNQRNVTGPDYRRLTDDEFWSDY